MVYGGWEGAIGYRGGGWKLKNVGGWYRSEEMEGDGSDGVIHDSVTISDILLLLKLSCAAKRLDKRGAQLMEHKRPDSSFC